MRLKVTIILALYAVFMNVYAQKSNVIDGVVWVVGDNAILRSDIEEARIGAQYDGTKIDGDPYCVLPERIAIQKLFLHQAALDSITVSESQVEQQVNAQLNFYLREIGSKEKVEEYFKRSMKDIKELLTTNFKEQSLSDQVKQSIVADVNVTPSDVREYYNSINKDSLPMVPNQVEVQIIMLDPEVPYTEIEATKNRLRDYAKRVNNGDADFSILARLYSDDVESAKNGGELGFVGKGSLVPEFSAAAFALTEPGQVSRVIETEYGYHIIQLIEKKEDKVNCRHILLRPEVSAELKIETLSRLDTIAKDIRTDFIKFEAAVALFSSDKTTKMSGGLMSNANNGSARFELQDLPPEISKKVNTMKAGEVSDPFIMYSQELRKDVFVIAKLKTKLQPHKANLRDDYQMLKGICENKLKSEAVEEWIKAKIKGTYVVIAPEWRNCDYKYDFWIK